MPRTRSSARSRVSTGSTSPASSFKRQRAFFEKMAVAPPRFADRLESLFTLPPAEAIAELGSLVLETQAIVQRELPDVDVTLRRPPGGAQVAAWD